MSYEKAKRLGFDEYMQNYVCKEFIRNEIENIEKKIQKNKSKDRYSYKEENILNAKKDILNKLLEE